MNDTKIQLRQVSGSASEASVRTHRVLIDRPLEKGGSNQGPMGGELFLASIGGCFMSNLLAEIHARKVDLFEVRVEVVGTLAETPARFSSVVMNVTSSGSADQLERLVEVADRGCIMLNTLRGKLDIRIHITHPLTAPSR